MLQTNSKMISMSVVFVGALVAFITYQLGLLERPPFLYHETFLGGRELHAIMATAREKNIGRHVERLLVGSQKGVEALENGATMMKAAAKAYGVESVDGATPYVSTGLYFDDPSAVEHPRWAIGWAVVGPSFEELQAMIPEIQKASGLSEPIKVVRIGGSGTETFTAQIPWRNALTPMIAPMLHWGRGFQTYEDYMEDETKSDEGVPAVALEVYVCGENFNYTTRHEYIDYTVLFGDIAHTWEDSFPGSLGDKKNTKEKTEADTATE